MSSIENKKEVKRTAGSFVIEEKKINVRYKGGFHNVFTRKHSLEIGRKPHTRFP